MRGMTPPPTFEQLCRDLLELAIRDELVAQGDAHPQTLTAGDLAGMANLLEDFCRQLNE